MKMNNNNNNNILKHQKFIKKLYLFTFLTHNFLNKNNFKNLFNQKLKEFQNILAFSLIELSIVLIIIGLLIAGITGGASLIESAKISSIVTDIRKYDQALATFYSLKGYLPGDIDRDGAIGYYSNDKYNSNSFPAPYNQNGNGYGIPNIYSAPFVELYLNNIIDFEPKNTNLINIKNNGGKDIGAIPTSNAYKNILYTWRYIKPGQIVGYEDQAYYWIHKYKMGNKFFLLPNTKDKTTNKIFQRLDIKIDDGIYCKGAFRGFCDVDGNVSGRVSYDDYRTTYCGEALYNSSF